MGFLDQSTNNIILDAVLTDLGREFLARNDGSFAIDQFALGDDEVDYTIIQKYGRTVGKEKIEKNTPVFEALTNQAYALKYRLISVPDPNLVRLPSLSFSATQTTGNVVQLGAQGNQATPSTKSVTIEQIITGEAEIPSDLRDAAFEVKMNNNFLRISSPADEQPEAIDSQGIASYLVEAADQATSQQGGKLAFSISTQSISDAQFTVFGTSTNKNLIKTSVLVRGTASGAVKEFEVQITKPS
tara:strand:- start:590 stop:1318 length:729 start_codon:yes stop_codon:yes gene_type:complete